MPTNLITLRVWGDFACFTRPEMKVERVSYPLITPSAARGVLEAVFWEPQMLFWIDSIRVVRRGQWISIRRNEVNDIISISNAKEWMVAPEKTKFIQADDTGRKEPLLDDSGKVIEPKREAVRSQRNMLALSGVEYLITAEIRLSSLAQPPRDNLGKYTDEFRRRAKSGKCHHRPGLGMREFAADFEWEDDPQAALVRRRAELAAREEEPFPWHEDLGLMLYDVFAPASRATGFQWLNADESIEATAAFEHTLTGIAKGEATKRRKTYAANPLRNSRGQLAAPQPSFFRATIRDSLMDCHPERVRILTTNPEGA